ncbi:MAG: hypothetical protein GF344_01090 [Chitinivibrionales bacterium]|nr:hypothetical protein [Chitinivibrionales bacterium]MBD3355696.1 hypothetical protein [Chitinivibrionales bacterium]
MAVIINEFEVVLEPQSSREEQEAGVAPAPQPSSQAVSPFALDMIMRRQLERQIRVRAD